MTTSPLIHRGYEPNLYEKPAKCEVFSLSKLNFEEYKREGKCKEDDGTAMKAVLWFCIGFGILLLTVSWLAGICESF
jgi:hypothetical protein